MFFQHAADADVPELTRLAHTVDRWRDEILAFHTTGGASNGPTEAVNLLIEKIRRLGHGYRNFTNYRRRLLLGCGITWVPSPPAESEAANQPSPRRARYRLPRDRRRSAIRGALGVSDIPVVVELTSTRGLGQVGSSMTTWKGSVAGVCRGLAAQTFSKGTPAVR